MRVFPLASLALLLAACSAKTTTVDATEVVARVDAAPDVLAALGTLRVRTASEQDGAWVNVDTKTFQPSDLTWPVDIVLTPLSNARASGYFEIVVDALDDSGAILVQTRGLSAFEPNSARVLPLSLATCGGKPLHFVCQDESQSDCYGPNCLTCVDTQCAPTPSVPASSLPTLDGGAPPDSAVVDAAHIDASHADGGLPDASKPDATTPDAGDAGPTQETCMAGYMPDGRGGCQDIDECAANSDDCDDMPDACVNTPGAFNCACPAGYQGTGRGADGCTDIDECATKTAQCDAQAMCNNTQGSYTCGACAEGYTGGANGSCVDIDECTSNNGGCSANAACINHQGAARTCACNSGYSGNGVGASGCTDVNECLTGNGGCASNATCTNQVGAPVTCACPSGYSGSGQGANGCVNINDCAPNPCQNGGTCTDGINAHTCSCGSSYTGANCELEVCPTTTVRTPAELASIKNCGIINGDLGFSSGAAVVNGDQIGNLSKVTGTLTLTTFGAQTPAITNITFPALTTVGGGVTMSDSSTIAVAVFPALTTIGTPGGNGGLQIGLGAFARVEMPALTTINGDVTIQLIDAFCSADFHRVSTVTGNVGINYAVNLPYVQVLPLVNAAKGTVTTQDVGCCTIISQQSCNADDNVMCNAITCP